MKKYLAPLTALLATLLSFNAAADYQPTDLFKIQGLSIGQAQDKEGVTGVTVLRFDKGAVAGVDVRGAAPGTRETDLLRPENLVQQVNAIVLSGGSAYGLDSMTGVMKYLGDNDIGFDVGVAKVPIVTGAVLFDLTIGDPKSRPDATMGYQATKSANRTEFKEGSFGAGTGATVGKIAGGKRSTKSGIGSYVIEFDSGLVIGAIVAVNAWGDVTKDGQVYAGTRSEDGKSFVSGKDLIVDGLASKGFAGRNTTIGVIVTNAKLTKTQALKIAQMGHDGYARAINPVHSMYDGDTLFAAGTGEIEVTDINSIGVVGAEVVQQAIYRAVESAESLGGLPTRNEITSNQ
ncbi:P1 family peptidase [Vibrio sp. SS-MA-C1-2]|uniref:P1 family peptidase n=1 Tax=Vibrio sp. SS-MA-C1-2 TaxID=2908646 RepID=UPI001F375FF3|nr:P1 family peptidase [Vibrio sp. SS-MA-C1-2]UJF18581.1 P1 family peptidase [Vibrio sp. SS-MA-C1-2]